MKTEAYINGKWIDSGSTFPVLDPSDNTLIANVTNCDVKETEKAVEAACQALPLWKSKTAKERASYLHRMKDLLLKNQKSMATIISMENGKPIKEAEGEVGFASTFFEWFAEEGRRCYGDHIPPPTTGKQLLTIREAAGVVALIIPWNFPIAMLARKVAAALSAGCTCVIKPAEDTPLTALYFAQICEEIQLPAGVINVIPCTRENAALVGQYLCQSSCIAVVSFTGSTEIAKILYQQCSSTIKRLALELGGNAPYVIFNTADINLAVQGLMAAKFRNTGQTCVTANRILVQQDIFDQVVQRLALTMDKELHVGPGLDPNHTQGPIINDRQFQRLDMLVKDAVTKGARVIRGGRVHARGGRFYEPTLLVDIRPEMRVFQEEIFGPIAVIMSFSTEEEAIQLSNSCDRGLAGYFFSNDLRQVWRVAKALEVGLVGINDPLMSTCEGPFGGIKMSGFGKEGSRYGLDEFCNIKFLSFASLD